MPSVHLSLGEFLDHVDEVIYQVALTGGDPWSGRVVFVGGRVEALLGYRPEEFSAPESPSLWQRILHPDDLGHVGERSAELVSQRRPVIRTYRLYSRRHEAYRWFEDRTVPRLGPDGSVTGYFGAARDVTECREANTRLSMLASAIEQTGDSVLITDRTGMIVFANTAFESSTGYSGVELQGKTPRILKSGHHGSEFYARLWSTLLAGQVFRGEFLNLRKNGELFLEEKTIAPVCDATGEVTHFVSASRDITLRRRIEQSVQDEQRLDALGLLAAGVAHDFNNLLTVLLGCAADLGERLPRQSPERALAVRIGDAAENAAGLTRQLLEFGRKGVSAPERLRPARRLEAMAPLLRLLAVPKCRLTTSIDAGCGAVRIDPSQFEQVVLNLVTNARNAMPGGGRLLVSLSSVARDRVPAEARVGAADRFVVLHVEDQGVGMEAETLRRIFEPFYTTRRDRGGTGLGLTIARSVAVAAGGGIDIRSAPGEGTTVRVYLPVDPDAVDTHENVERPAPPAR